MFDSVKKKLQSNISALINGQPLLFLTGATKDDMWQMYLSSFPEKDGLRQENNCNACRSFIKTFGNAVTIVENKLVSIWDFKVDDEVYQSMLNNMRDLVIAEPIRDVFVTDTKKIGIDTNFELLPDGTSLKREHFFCELPKEFVCSSRDTLDTVRGAYRDQKQVFKRSMEEISTSAVETTLELIATNSLYRGVESKGVLETFLTHKKKYDKLPNAQKDNYAWINSVIVGPAISKIRNSAIGTLLVDISGDVELDIAVSKFEKIMAPSNYKRPTPVVSKKMIEEAEKTIGELGLVNSLRRKMCCPDDITIDNLIFVDRGIKKNDSVFGELKENIPVNPKSFSKVDTITMKEFVEKVVPTASSIEILFENRHIPNLVSLVGPEDKGAPSLFKWPNNFSWSYKNALADSLKEKVKRAGGKIEGLLRISLEWFNYNDLDLHVIEPDNNEIWYGYKISRTGGHLDVDMNISPTTRTPVENVIYPYNSKIKYGKYNVHVHNFNYRESTNPQFNVEIEAGGELFSFSNNEGLPHKKKIQIAEFEYRKDGSIEFKSAIKSTVSSQKIWGLDTNKFHPISMAMFSPNYWGDSRIGNQHVFFIINGAHNDDDNVRGFFNEFLRNDLEKDHKRVFETLANKMKVEKSENPAQVSGLGFSSTIDNSFICKVNGTFSRTLKVTI